jgi:PknH-like extracellular domain
MINLAPRLCAVAVAASVVLSGCAQTTSGSPVRAPRSSPAGPAAKTFSASALDDVMLSVGDVSSIVGGTGLQVSNSAQDLTDSSDTIDDVECLGVIFAAEKQVYAGSNWKAARDQIIREPGDNKQHWVEQTVVLFSSWEKAADFFDKAQDQWTNCANKSVTTQGSGNASYNWKLGQTSEPSATELTIDMNQQNSNNWSCQHALSAVSNIIIEGVACGHGISNEGDKIVQRIVQNATSQ